MTFCSNCGKQASDVDKFCTSCGAPIKEIKVSVTEQVGEIIKEEIKQDENFSEPKTTEPILEIQTKKTTKTLGDNLEEIVSKILRDKGYETLLRQKKIGNSGQYNEIDVLATRKGTTLAVECKNYAKGTKVGIKEMRDFTAKLEDLDLEKGLFVTSADFSSDARGWAGNSPLEIDLWNGSEVEKEFLQVSLGRSQSHVVRVENSLAPKGTFEDYSVLLLKNKEAVGIKLAELTFSPFYIVSFNLREQFKTPDKQIHSVYNSGKYFVNGLSGEIIYRSDERGNTSSKLDEEQKQVIRDLEEIEPQRTVEVIQANNCKITKTEPSMLPKEANFKVQTQIIEDNKTTIEYKVRLPRNETENRDYTHVPNRKEIKTQSKLIYAPRWEIEFESGEFNYKRIVLPASDVVIQDDIANCKHTFRTKHTFAVCSVCGIAKCEGDIMQDEKSVCYCKKHAPEETKSKKESGLSQKLKRLSIGKK